MKKATQMHRKMSRRVLFEALRSDRFLTIDEIVDRLKRVNYFDESAEQQAIDSWHKSQARKIMREEKDERGRPAFANVEISDSDGETTNAYLQQSLFDVSHYEQVISYHNARAFHHIAEAHEYAKDLKARHSVQIELPFPMPEEIRKAA